MTKNVLFIVYYFPPLSGAGVQRPLKFVKYLREFGWLPFILTTTDDSCYEYKDYSLIQEIPNDIFVTRVADILDLIAGMIVKLPGLLFILEKFRGKKSEDYRRAIRNHLLRVRFLEFPDSQFVWAISAYFSALKLIRKYPIDVVFTTSAPYSNHLIGLWLKKSSGIAWVADFRDEWSQNPIISTPTKLHLALIKKVERQIINSADHVISVSDPFVHMFRSLSENVQKFTTITNGYDEKDFEDARSLLGEYKERKFCITNVGTFYELPTHFFQAVEALLTSGEIPVNDLRIVLVGKYSYQFQFLNPAWKDIICYTGYLSHNEAITELLKAAALFFIISAKRGKRMYPGKLFEYIAAYKPILAMVPTDSIAAELIHRTRTGWVVPPDNMFSIQSALAAIYRNWKSGNLEIEPDRDWIRRYERHNLTRSLAKILDQVTGK